MRRSGAIAPARTGGAGVGAGAFVLTVALAIPTLTIVAVLPRQGAQDTVLSRISAGASVLGFAILATTGAVLLHRQPRHPMGRLLTVAGLAQLSTMLTLGWVPYAVSAGARPLDPILWITNWVWVPAQVAVLVVLLRFPEGRLAGRGWRVVEGAVLAWGALALLATALAPGPLGSSSLEQFDNPYGWEGLIGVIDGLLSGLFLLLPVLNVVAAAALIWRWRGADAGERQRLRWVAAAAIIAIVTAPLVLFGTDSAEAPAAVALLLLPAAIAVAVLRRRLWELGVVAHLAVTAGLTGLVLVTTYAAAVRWLPGSMWPVVAGLAVAALAFPVHRLIRFLLDRFLLGTNGDPNTIADRVANQSRTQPGQVLQDAAAELARTLRVPWVAFTDEGGDVVAASGTGPADRHGVTEVPLVVAGAEVGLLRSAERAPGEGLSPRDLRVLSEVAAVSALVLHSIRIDRRLAESRDRLAAIRSEERARVQRDLHDGLGPVLGGIQLRAEAARNLTEAGADPARITAQLDAIGQQATGAIAEVRRLIQELRPTALEQAGLSDALARAIPEVADHLHRTVTLELPADLESAVEVAAFRIVIEAVRNAARHAEATRVAVAGRVEDDRLVLTVTDDGRGLAGSTPGVGIRAMTERATELGGSLTLDSPVDGGCRIRAELPLRPEGHR